MNRKKFLKSAAIAGTSLAISPDLFSKQSKSSFSSMEPKIVRALEGKVVNVIGDLQTFKLTGEDTNGQFTLIEEENDPGVMIPMHVHSNEDEVFRVLEGQMELTVGDQTTILSAGDIGFGPRGVPHSWKIVGEHKTKVILSIFPAGLEMMFEELGQLPMGPPDFPKVASICGKYGVRFV